MGIIGRRQREVKSIFMEFAVYFWVACRAGKHSKFQGSVLNFAFSLPFPVSVLESGDVQILERQTWQMIAAGQ
jgi:hypothetical protein